ncbi:response regulator transcription factor [Noviherbaspirillum sp. Root189]|uniref:response regulator transcription factor n=1 Tax=Noviherbaspirillum sp. Root189 TaxID=1736487 RepID=UPI00070EB234|nr:DNA-binding response regulator [Noviherbaspirillum sp. Root189]KRB67962.1 LuxR family transcriptional regulator [Noviherbaspirillum sp. Root189]
MSAKMPGPESNAGVVLVVDDDLGSLNMLCDALTTEGYSVLVARDAAEALQRFEMTLPDAVLLDAIMPNMNGFDLCQHIKQEPTWAHVPVIFMTGLSETEQIVHAFSCGGVDYVVKPIKIPEVLVRVAAHIRNANAARLARQAVDIAGMGIVLLDRQQRISWCSPRADHFLKNAFPCTGEADASATWLRNDTSGYATKPLPGGRAIQAQRIGQAEFGETMFLIREVGAQAPSDAMRLPDAVLTPRETEVLSWLAKGKTNRDIADILGMSPRTVNKHLEHIFVKLGVETRAAAAALASRMHYSD